jgi:hypothetical protein
VQDPGGAFGQADNAIGVARARLAAVLHAQTLCSALSNVNGTAVFFCCERASRTRVSFCSVFMLFFRQMKSGDVLRPRASFTQAAKHRPKELLVV